MRILAERTRQLGPAALLVGMTPFHRQRTLLFSLALVLSFLCVQAVGSRATMDEGNSLKTLAEVATSTTSATVQKITEGAASFGPIGRTILMVLRFIPTALFWLVSFATITLPTWIFTVLSMSLTFTMNMTTL